MAYQRNKGAGTVDTWNTKLKISSRGLTGRVDDMGTHSKYSKTVIIIFTLTTPPPLLEQI